MEVLSARIPKVLHDFSGILELYSVLCMGKFIEC